MAVPHSGAPSRSRSPTSEPGTLSERLARFVASLSPSDLPEPVRERARLLMLDSVGIAWAAATETWADGDRKSVV